MERERGGALTGVGGATSVCFRVCPPPPRSPPPPCFQPLRPDYTADRVRSFSRMTFPLPTNLGDRRRSKKKKKKPTTTRQVVQRLVALPPPSLTPPPPYRAFITAYSSTCIRALGPGGPAPAMSASEAAAAGGDGAPGGETGTSVSNSRSRHGVLARGADRARAAARRAEGARAVGVQLSLVLALKLGQ